ncbi:hypothetical protein OE88DRAFT_1643222 [Heliocybe sulcata]|uniref:Uncharacterized protein n=1 Tax=Heliocybe sulcata TaxID=5364 RepID=A0A5C3NBU8_9AGAM|nr:hypothetical protein OE88DRAFT_1643222 [Heliocybe sulcata]
MSSGDTPMSPSPGPYGDDELYKDAVENQDVDMEQSTAATANVDMEQSTAATASSSTKRRHEGDEEDEVNELLRAPPPTEWRDKVSVYVRKSVYKVQQETQKEIKKVQLEAYDQAKAELMAGFGECLRTEMAKVNATWEERYAASEARHEEQMSHLLARQGPSSMHNPVDAMDTEESPLLHRLPVSRLQDALRAGYKKKKAGKRVQATVAPEPPPPASTSSARPPSPRPPPPDITQLQADVLKLFSQYASNGGDVTSSGSARWSRGDRAHVPSPTSFMLIRSADPSSHNKYLDIVRHVVKKAFNVKTDNEIVNHIPVPADVTMAYETGDGDPPGPDPHNIQLDVSKSDSLWNVQLTSILVSRVVHESRLMQDGGVSLPARSTEYIQEMVANKLDAFRIAWRRASPRTKRDGTKESDEELEGHLYDYFRKVSKSTRMNSRRHSKYETRLDTVTGTIDLKQEKGESDVAVWQYLQNLVEELGVDGTSSDDTDTEDTVTGVKSFRVRRMPWRRDMESEMKLIDSQRFAEGVSDNRGSAPALRTRGKPHNSSHRKAAVGLPVIFYDSEWLNDPRAGPGQRRRAAPSGKSKVSAKKPYGVSLTVDEYNLHQAQAAARSRASRQQNEASPSLRKETQEACQCTECLEVDPGGVYRSPAAHKAHQILITHGRNYDPDDNLAAPDIDEGTSSQAAEESGSDIDDIDELSSSFVLATLADEDAVANPSLPPKDKLLTSLTEQLVQLTLGPADTMEGQLPSTMPLPSGSMPEPDAQDAVIALDGRRITRLFHIICCLERNNTYRR